MKTSVRLVSTALRRTAGAVDHDLSGPDAAAVLITKLAGGRDREHFIVVHLSVQHRAVGVEVAAIGDLTAAVIHPREVFKAAILSNAAAIVVGHNHPSGDLTPSEDDCDLARILRVAGIILGIPVIDFLIVAGKEWRSVKADNQ